MLGIVRQRALHAGDKGVRVCGMVHVVRPMGGVVFVSLRMADGLLQCTAGPDVWPEGLRPESALALVADVVEEPRAPQGIELAVTSVQVLSAPMEDSPLQIHKGALRAPLDTDIAARPLTLRHAGQRAIFRIQAELAAAFRAFFAEEGLCEIFSPKIVSGGAEGGANIFRLDYFGKRAFLAQSPQFYKQMMVPVYGSVYEIGPVFRAEKHDTPRHMSEYISVDAELGFIKSFEDIMAFEERMLQQAMTHLATACAGEIRHLGISLPTIADIPRIRFREAKEQVAERFARPIRDPHDLEPEEERLLCELIHERTGSEFVFITHYPERKRPFYAMDDPEDPRLTLSFDLLFRGLEVTTGGQRIHNHQEQVAKMQRKGLDPAEFASYLQLHKYGCPPHGGFGLGLERLTMQLLGLDNIRRASLFPRDTQRLTP